MQQNDVGIVSESHCHGHVGLQPGHSDLFSLQKWLHHRHLKSHI